MASEAEFAALLAQAEQAVFHGPPEQALVLLEQAGNAADDPARLAVRWLTGVALGSLGRYGQALAELEPLLGRPGAGLPDTALMHERLFAGYGAGTVASLLRQVGDHAGGESLDRWGLDVLAGLAVAGAEAWADCAIGWAADAVGLGQAEVAMQRLQAAADHVARCPPEQWRVRVRLGWAVAEVALLTGRPGDAVTASRQAVLGAERARAPRHVAKSLLFLGVAQLEAADDGAAPVAVGVLRRSAMLAEELGLLPLVWPARAVLGAALATGATSSAAAREAQESLESARAAVRTIAAGLPPALRQAWLTRPDIEALLAG